MKRFSPQIIFLILTLGSSFLFGVVFSTSVLIGCLVLFALSNGFWLALLGFVLARAIRNVQHPLHAAWLNQRLEPSTRATVLSLNGQADAVGQIAGGPMIGFLGNSSLRLALLSSAVMTALTLPMYARVGKKEQHD